MLSAALNAAFVLFGAAQAARNVVPGAIWTATNTGKHVQAHGAGIIEENGVYYMIGEDKTDGTFFQAINCYSSTDLIEWSFEGSLLTRTQEAGDLGPNRIIERPKVIKNDSTGKYVLWLHVDSSDYKDARVGYATGDSICGQYTYLGSSRPLGFQSRDIGSFKDEDGSAYLLTEDREYGTRIIKMSDDYLEPVEVTFGWEYFAESPALIKRGDTYYMFGSHLTGWDPNDNVYVHATSLSGPWSEWTEFAPVGSRTHTSQVSFVIPLGADRAIYTGDRWHSTNLAASTYVWLPLDFSGGPDAVRLDWHDAWKLDVEGGAWAEASPAAELEAEAAGLSNGARTVSCSRCSNGQAAGYIGGDEDGTALFEFEVGYAGEVTLVVEYLTGDTAPRSAKVTVNGAAEQTVEFQSTNHLGGSPGRSTVHVELVEGRNTVAFSRAEGWGPDIDQLLVPQAL